MREIKIVGAGLTGSLLAISLAQKNYKITLIEARDDLRNKTHAEGRSINLAISERGLHALEVLNLKQQVLDMAVPVLGRMMHDNQGNLSSQAYGRNPAEHNYSLSRFELNQFLLSELSQYKNVDIKFNTRIERLELDNNEPLLACDGAFSSVRAALSTKRLLDFETIAYPHSYKEIHLAQNSGLDLNHLHIWPRGDLMLMALANHDGSFTCTLYLKTEQFERLDQAEHIINLFNQHFPDFVPLVPDLTAQFMNNPTGSLLTVKCAPWYYQDKVLLLGDAAHAMVPFLGQGMNCGFEDVTLFNQLLEEFNQDWQSLFAAFYTMRKDDADAITQMAQDNYHEMSSDVADPRFLLKKKIEQELMKRYPEHYVSKYVLISYTNEPYAKAMAEGEKQAKILTQLSEGINSVDDLDWSKVDALIRAA
jgi:kynurenine 3-monooxygenase